MTEMETMEVQAADALVPVSPGAEETYSIPSSHVDPARMQKGQNFSVAAMVLGIVSVVLAWPMGFICGVLGIVFSQVSKNARGYMDGKARAGLVCGIIGLCIFVLIMALFMGLWLFAFTNAMHEGVTF